MNVLKALASCGIKSVSDRGYVTLTDEVEKEVKLIVKTILENRNLKQRCVFCTHFREYENDYCDVLGRKVLFCNTCEKMKKRKDVGREIIKEVIGLEKKEIELMDNDL